MKSITLETVVAYGAIAALFTLAVGVAIAALVYGA